jgi:hypothetical protein
MKEAGQYRLSSKIGPGKVRPKTNAMQMSQLRKGSEEKEGWDALHALTISIG